MKRLSIYFIFISLFIFTSSFGLLEYNSLTTKAKTIQLDSTQKAQSLQSLKSNYPNEITEEKKQQKETEESNFIVQNLAKYVLVGIKTVFTALIKFALSF
ncbi:MAG: hypothetical protein ACKOWQ_07725 [Aquirufa sp.]